MEIKEFNNQDSLIQQNSVFSKNKPSKLSSLGIIKPDSNNISSEKILLTTNEESISKSDSNKKANDLINVINIASEATKEIEKIVSSLDGIVEQAQNKNLNSSRKDKLEDEANLLANEIENKVKTDLLDKVKDIESDDDVKVYLNLNLKFPYNFNIGNSAESTLFNVQESESVKSNTKFKFSDDEELKKSVSLFKKVEENFSNIKKSYTKIFEDVKNSVIKNDVIFQNNESSLTSLRDIDQALNLASGTRNDISLNPQLAIESFKGLSANALSLLKNE